MDRGAAAAVAAALEAAEDTPEAAEEARAVDEAALVPVATAEEDAAVEATVDEAAAAEDETAAVELPVALEGRGGSVIPRAAHWEVPKAIAEVSSAALQVLI